MKTWRILVNGTYIEPPPAATAGASAAQQQRRGNRGGRLVVSSEFARLTVAPQFLTLKFQAASVEQGKEVDLIVNINKSTDFPGEAKLTLIGLPNKATTEPVTITESRYQGRVSPQDRPEDAPRRIKKPVLPGRHHERRRADHAQSGDGAVAGR